MKQVNVIREEMRNFFLSKLTDGGFDGQHNVTFVDVCLDIVDLL